VIGSARRASAGGTHMKSLVIAMVFVVGIGRALADPSPPWADGVPNAQQEHANALFDEANQLFAQQAHGPALEKYRAAIALWDHPMIRFNMAVTEIRLDRILEADHDLTQAMRFGAEPFTPELYRQALDYQTLLKGRVGAIEVSCEQADVQILLDGKPWFECPGKQTFRALTGEHVIVGDLAGFLTSSSRVFVAGGAVAVQRITLVSLEAAGRLEYPRPRWVPWTIAGSGAAIAAGGLAFYLMGKNQIEAFHNDFASVCAKGCDADLSDQPVLRRERDGAILKGEIAVSMMIAGGAITAGGLVLAILNRPVRKLPRIEAAPTAGGLAASVGWKF
jgi:hypothetical protein